MQSSALPDFGGDLLHSVHLFMPLLLPALGLQQPLCPTLRLLMMRAYVCICSVTVVPITEQYVYCLYTTLRLKLTLMMGSTDLHASTCDT